MNEKLLWKIESLWDEHYRSTKYCQLASDKSIASSIKSKFLISEDTAGSFSLVDKFSFEKTGQAVFSDDYGSYYGLSRNQVVDFEGKLVYLFDNHNKFLVPLFHLHEILNRPLKVLHIDAHEDDALYQHKHPKQFSEETVIELLEKTRISDFYDSLSGTQVISEITRITHSQDFENLPHESYDILSLDIDIFGPEGEFTDVEKKVAIITAAMRQSSIITIATSPGFINQDFAESIIKAFFKS